MPERIKQQLIVLASAVVLFTNLGGPRLWDRDEPRNAGCAAEMLARGDWVVPVFNGELRTHKPVLLYWLMMTSYELFGVNEFAARFWSALLGIGTVLMTYGMGRRLFDDSAGFWAALSLAPALMFGVASRAATPDAVLIFCSTLAIYLYVRFTWDGQSTAAPTYFPPQWWQVALVYGAMGLAILAKGPVGLVLPTAVIGMFLLLMRRTGSWRQLFSPVHFLSTCVAMRPLTAIGIALAVALPWYLWVDARTSGAWTAGFFLEHNLHRATQSMEGHRGNILFYPGALAIGFFPWSVFLLPMVIDTVRQLRLRVNWNPGYAFAACWVGVYVVLFSLAKTKLPSYITPCYPGLALLMGAFVSRVVAQELQLSQRWLKLGLSVAMLVGVIVIIALPVVAHILLPGEAWLAMLGVPLLVAGVVGWWLVARQDYQRMASLFATGAVAFSTLAFALATQRVDRHQHADQLLTTIFHQSQQPTIGYYGALEPSWIFYSGQSLTNVTVPNDPQPKAPEKSPIVGTSQWENRDKTVIADFFASSPDRYLIAMKQDWQTIRPFMPNDVEILNEVPYFLQDDLKFRWQYPYYERKHYELVVIGRRNPSPKTAGMLPEQLQRRR